MKIKSNHIILLFGVLALSLFLISSSKYGLGLSNDSFHYLYAAKSFSQSGALTNLDGTLLSIWPPLYPFLLSTLGHSGNSILLGGMLLNALAYSGTVVLSLSLIKKKSKNSISIFLGGILLISAVSFLETHLFLWSEGVFIFFLLVHIHLLFNYLRTPTGINLLLLAIISSLLCLQRYIGVIFILNTGAVLFFYFNRCSLKTRLLRSITFGALATSPLFLYILRNIIANENPVGGRVWSGRPLLENISQTISEITSWILPRDLHSAYAYTLIGTMTLILLYTSIKKNAFLRIMSFTMLSYIISIIILFNITWVHDLINQRILAIIYPIITIIVAIQLPNVLSKLTPVRKTIIIPLFSIWCFYPISRSYSNINHWVTHGIGGFNNEANNGKPIIAYLKENNQRKSHIYTNKVRKLFCLIDQAENYYTKIRTDNNEIILLNNQSIIVSFRNQIDLKRIKYNPKASVLKIINFGDDQLILLKDKNDSNQ